MAVTSEQFTLLEDRVDDVADKASKLEGSYEHLATKDDVTKTGLRIILWVSGFILTSFGIQVAILLNLLSRMPG